jgi:acetyl esterase/lipase
LAPTSVDDGAAGLDRVDDDPELAQLASPRHRVHAGAPPHLILHGDRDVMVNHEQSRVLHEALSAVRAQPICLLITGAGRDPLTLGGLLSMSQCTVLLSWRCNGR